MRLLLAEDDPQLGRTLARGLREHAYVVDLVADGEAALARAAVNDYALVVLDVLMPGRTGFEVCRELRRRSLDVPVLMLTARDAAADKITGLDAGADDYLTKPFDFGELLARLRALLRRRGEMLPDVIRVADLVVDTRAQSVTRAGRPVALTTKEYTFLEFLARNTGRVVSRAEITAQVWDDNHDPLTNAIEVYVTRLRQKLDADAAVPLIHTRRGAGYLLADPSSAPGA